MSGNIIKCFLIILILVSYLNCGAGSNSIKKSEGNIMSFEISKVAYPVWLGNFQRNSYVPVDMKSKWNPLWSKTYIEINEEIMLTPYSVLINDNIVGVISESDMILYDTAGTFKSQVTLSGSAGVIFGQLAMAFIDPSYQLTYRDYEGNQIGGTGVIPMLGDWAGAIFMVPSLNDVLAAVQFTGGPQRAQQKYYVYKFLREDGDVAWLQEFDGRLDFAMVSNKNKKIVLIKGKEITLINAADGNRSDSFNIDIGRPLTASLDLNDNLIILSEQMVDGKLEKSLKAFSPDGRQLWSLMVDKPQENQPASCGGDGRVYFIDDLQLKCIINGNALWTALLKPAERNWMTITRDNHAVVLNGSFLALFSPNGEKIYEKLITKTDDEFYAPPAIDRDGKIFVAGLNALYCFE